MEERNLETLRKDDLSSSSSTCLALGSTGLALGWTGALGFNGAPGIGVGVERRVGEETMWRGGVACRNSKS